MNNKIISKISMLVLVITIMSFVLPLCNVNAAYSTVTKKVDMDKNTSEINILVQNKDNQEDAKQNPLFYIQKPGGITGEEDIYLLQINITTKGAYRFYIKYTDKQEEKVEYLYTDQTTDGYLQSSIGDGYFDLPGKIDDYIMPFYIKINGNTTGVRIERSAKLSGDQKALNSIETMFADMFNSIAKGAIAIVSFSMGRSITMDDLIFNHYDETRLDFFTESDSEDAEQADKRGSLIIALVDVINNAYKIFKAIAILGYIVILVYMAIRILLGITAEKKAKYMDFIKFWITGVIILFLFPIVIKYTVKINNALVLMVENSKKEIFVEDYSEYKSETNYDGAIIEGVGAINFDEVVMEGSDYMSYIAGLSERSGKISYSLVFLVMAVQLIFMVIYYYKRVFMFAFLIVIFPLVAFSYALDKIADGKSQSLNVWMKEMILNIIVQAFHAVIYVFALGATYSASATTPDVLIMLIGVTFLFKGEDIIRRIFGQQSTTGEVKTLAESAASTIAKYQIAKKAVKSVTDNVIGSASHLGRYVGARREVKKYQAQLKVFEEMSEPETTGYERMAHRIDTSTPEDQKELIKAVATLNNRKHESKQDKARALQTLMKYNGKGGVYDEIIGESPYTQEQLDRFSQLNGKVAQIASGTSTRKSIEISQIIKVELETIVGAEEAKEMYGVMVSGMAMYGVHSDRVTSKKTIKREMNERLIEVEKLRARIRRDDTTDTTRIGEANRVADLRTAELMNSVIDPSEEPTMGRRERARIREVARNIAILESEDGFTREEIYRATKDLGSATVSGNERLEKMIKDAGCDVNAYRHLLAKSIKEEAYGSDDLQEEARRDLSAFEGVRSRKYVEDEDTFTVHEAIRREEELGEDTAFDSRLEEIRSSRKNQNMEEVTETKSIAEQLIAEGRIDVTSRTEAPRTLAGYTKEEIGMLEQTARYERREHLARMVTTTAGVVLAGPLGDYVAEKAAGKKKEELSVYDAETDTIVKFKANSTGAFSQTAGAYRQSGNNTLEGPNAFNYQSTRAIIEQRAKKRNKSKKK